MGEMELLHVCSVPQEALPRTIAYALLVLPILGLFSLEAVRRAKKIPYPQLAPYHVGLVQHGPYTAATKKNVLYVRRDTTCTIVAMRDSSALLADLACIIP